MSPAEQNELNNALLRGTLSAQQEKRIEEFLAADPGTQPEWEQELRLNQLLRQVPDAPVSSNFTARVLATVGQNGPAPARPAPSRSWLINWLPKLATFMAVLGLTFASYHQHRVAARHALAEQLAQIAKLAPETPLELLENFDAINRLNQVPRDTDRELIAALQ